MGEFSVKIDSISKPKTFWYEDLDGNEIPWDIYSDDPFPSNYKQKEVYQNCVGLEVRHSVCKQHSDPAWPIRLMKWIIKKMPNSWKGNPSEIYAGSTTINCCYPIVKYLVENRGFSFNEAAVAASQMCERCMNLCLVELANEQVSPGYFDRISSTHCKYCKEMDPEYNNKHRVWCCYRTFKLGGDVAKAYKNVSVYSDEKYMKENRVSY